MTPHDSILDADVIAMLAGALRPVTLSAEQSQHMRARLMQRIASDAARADVHADVHADISAGVVRAHEGVWRALLPGVHVKTLRQEARGGAFTALWRLDAGASVPPHPHGLEEECLVLQGHVLLEGQQYGTGDYMLAGAGSRHRTMSAPAGALLMIRGEDPFLMAATLR